MAIRKARRGYNRRQCFGGGTGAVLADFMSRKCPRRYPVRTHGIDVRCRGGSRFFDPSCISRRRRVCFRQGITSHVSRLTCRCYVIPSPLLVQVITSFEADAARTYTLAVMIGVMSYATAFAETLTISGFPYYEFKDRDMAYVVGSAFYGIYFIVR